MQSFLEWIFGSDEIYSAVTSITWSYVGVCLILAPGLLIINTLFNYARNIFKAGISSTSFFDKSEIIRCVVIVVFLGSYVPAMSMLDWFGNLVNKETVYSDRLVKQAEDAFQSYMKSKDAAGESASDAGTTGDEGTDDQSISIWNVLTGILSPTNIMSHFSLALTKIMLAIVRYVVQAVAFGMQKVLFVLGPFAFVLSMLPGREGVLGSWFGTYVTCIMVGVVCNVLDAVVWSSMAALDSAIYAGNSVNPLAFSSLNCVIIIMYCLAFWLAGKLVNASDAGKVLSAGVAGATTMATQGMGMLSKLGAKAAPGKAGDIIGGNQ